MKKIFIPIIALTISFFACDKINNEDNNIESGLTDTELSVVADDLANEALIENINQTVDEELLNLDKANYQTQNLKSFSSNLAICMTITVDKPDTAIFPKIITIEYAKEGCSDVINGDTITKKGKIFVTVTGRYFKTGSERTMSFEEFYINDVKIEGTRVLKNMGLNLKNNMYWTISIKDGKLIYGDTSEITFESERIREWVNNGTPLVIADDYFLITGSWAGTTMEDKKFEKNISDTIRKNFGCPYFVKGKMDFVINNAKDTLSINFGNGICDKKATISKGGKSKEVDLDMKRFRSRNKGN
jgi:hypothetical protein